jgi:hypothetical protein
MKNIHVLPTEKPSRFYFNNNDKCFQLCEVSKKSTPLKINQNIYITSDEEIKERDYVICDNKLYKIIVTGVLYNDDFTLQTDIEGVFLNPKYCSKIILTTDQDLINDGVQAIDDDFLEWFVKNPSCYEVEVLFACRGLDGNTPIGEYRIIIPQEEPKEDVIANYIDRHIVQAMVEVAKQERMSGSKTVSKILDGGKPNKFLIDEIGQFNFTKNKLYNQEEVGELVYKIIGEYGNHYGIMIDGEMINELFEKFKKK